MTRQAGGQSALRGSPHRWLARRLLLLFLGLFMLFVAGWGMPLYAYALAELDFVCDTSYFGPACGNDLHDLAMIVGEDGVVVDGWAVGDNGTLLRYEAGRWQAEPRFSGQHLYAIQMVGSQEGWIVGGIGTLFHLENGAWQSVPMPDGFGTPNLNGLFLHSPTEGWAVGQQGKILRLQNGVWRDAHSNATRPTDKQLRDVFMTSASNGWAVGDGGAILHYTDGLWQTVSAPSTANIYSVYFPGADFGWAGTERYLYAYNGEQWVEAADLSRRIRHVAPAHTGDTDVWLATECDGLSYLTETRRVWGNYPIRITDDKFASVRTPGCLYAMELESAAMGWGVGRRGTILRYVNGVWVDSQQHRDPVTLHAIDLDATGQGFAVGEGGLILRHAGEQWQNVSHTPPLRDLAMIDATRGWAVGGDEQSAAIWQFTEGDWRAVDAPTQQALFGVDFAGPDAGWAVGNQGAILRYTEGAWQPMQSGIAQTLLAVHALNSEEAWAVGEGGVVLRFVDGVWQVEPSFTSSDLFAIQMLTSDTGWVGGTRGRLFLLRDGTWREGNWRSFGVIHDIVLTDAETGWAIDSDDGLIALEGGVWRAAPNSFNLRADAMRGLSLWQGNQGVAVGLAGLSIYFNGQFWQSQASAGQATLQSVQMVSPTEAWAVGEGLIYHYDDGVWDAVLDERQTDEDLLSVAVVGPAEAWAGGRDGTLLHYQSGGWHAVQSAVLGDITDIVFHSPNDGWAAVDPGGLLRFDGGAWSLYTQPADAIQRLSFYAPDAGWAAADESILRLQNGIWQTELLPKNAAIRGLHMLSEQEGYAVSGMVSQNNQLISSRIFHYQSGVWVEQSVPNLSALGSVAMHEDAQGMTVGWAVSDAAIGQQRGDIWRYNGAQWLPIFDYEYRLHQIKNLPAPAGATRAWSVGAQVILHTTETWSGTAPPLLSPSTYLPVVIGLE